jgi:hypothetical protein
MPESKSERHLTAQSQVEVTKYLREVLDEPEANGLAIVETRLEEKFTGDLVGNGRAAHLRLERPDGSGNLICYERITGTLGGRRGSFLLEASGAMQASHYVHGRWEIVAGSGTGELEGIRGYAAFMARRDEASKSGWAAETALTYWFQAPSTEARSAAGP